MSENVIEKKEPVVFLRGKRIYMRPIEMADLPSLQRFVNDPDVREFVGTQFPQSEIAEKEFVERIGKSSKNPSDIVLGIVLMGTDQLIGIMGLHGINWKDRTGATGAMIGIKDYWGKGYGTEAKMIFLNYIFNTLNLRKICSNALKFNGRSIGFNAKCGYKKEGVQKKHVFVDGDYVNLVLTAVFRENFMPLWQAYKQEYLS